MTCKKQTSEMPLLLPTGHSGQNAPYPTRVYTQEWLPQVHRDLGGRAEVIPADDILHCHIQHWLLHPFSLNLCKCRHQGAPKEGRRP
jgi:hypothetical protein